MRAKAIDLAWFVVALVLLGSINTGAWLLGPFAGAMAVGFSLLIAASTVSVDG
jgi:hypothetical protein